MTHAPDPIRRGDDGRIRNIDVPALVRRPDGFARLRAALSELSDRMPAPRAVYDEPPWTICPDLPRGSVAWHTPGGEPAMSGFIAWYRGQSPERQARIRAEHPEPPAWQGFYETLT